MTVIGIAKRLEELYYPGDQYPLYLDKKSETLKVIQHLRDEAHRFGITFHRKKRDKGTLDTELELIEGIGKTTAEKLLKYFKSVKKIREANEETLLEVVNLKQAKAIFAGSFLSGADKPNSVVGGVLIGVTTYSFRDMIVDAEHMLQYCLQCN